MKTFLRSVIALFVVLMAIGIVHRIDRHFRPALAPGAPGKQEQHAPGTVLTVSRTAGGEGRLCFSIDSLAALPAADRTLYETREHARQTVEGPRCVNLAATPRASALRPGDAIDLLLRPQNGGSLQVIHIAKNGQNL